MAVKYVKRQEIDEEKWDECVKQSTKPLIYGISWYLDAATNGQWDGIVVDNYEAVMPLPWNRKLIVKQVYTPHVIQQLGPFSRGSLPTETMRNVLNIINNKFIQNNLSLSEEIENSQKRVNLILPLHSTYDELYQNFKRDRRYDARKVQFDTLTKLTADELFVFFRESSSEIIKKGNVNLPSFRRVINASFSKQQAESLGIYHENKLISAVFFTIFQNRLTLLISTTNEVGYQKRANVFLINEVIKRYANQHYILDFEGSEIPGVQRFYRSFGAIKEYYYNHEHVHPMAQPILNILKRLKKAF